MYYKVVAFISETIFGQAVRSRTSRSLAFFWNECMALDSSSTRTQVLAQYNNNLSWDGVAAKAVLALEAVRWLLINRPAGMTQDGKGGVNYSSLETEKAKLEKYVGSFGTSANRAPFVKARPIS